MKVYINLNADTTQDFEDGEWVGVTISNQKPSSEDLQYGFEQRSRLIEAEIINTKEVVLGLQKVDDN